MQLVGRGIEGDLGDALLQGGPSCLNGVLDRQGDEVIACCRHSQAAEEEGRRNSGRKKADSQPEDDEDEELRSEFVFCM